MASLWGELKRRNVVRVAIAYAVVSWLILQLAEVLVPMLTLPEWVSRFVLLVIVIGLPLALFFAWAFELTPEGVKKEKDVDRSQSITHVTGRKLDFMIIGVLAVALVFFVADKFMLPPETLSTTDFTKEIVATEVQQSIAVLPFVNMSSDPEQEYFSDGLSEEILNLLAKIPELKVIGRTSSFAFKGKNEDLRGIGQALGVNTVLEGSVRKSGDRLRITAQLIDVSDGAHIWSETYDRMMTDVFEIQDSVAAEIIDALQVHVGVMPTRGRPTEDPEAYTLFLRAKALINKWETVQAADLLRKVVERDPMFAEAWEMLALTYWQNAGTAMPSAEGQKLTAETAAKAIAINPDLLMAQSLYQSGDIDTYSFAEEIRALEHAARMEPGKTGSFDMLSYDLIEAGYIQEAVNVAEQFVELDPLSPAAHSRLSQALMGIGQLDEALESIETATQLGAEYGSYLKAAVAVLRRQDEEAIAHLEDWVQEFDQSSGWVRHFIVSARDADTGSASLDEQIPQIVESMPDNFKINMTRLLIGFYAYFGHFDRLLEIILDLDLKHSTWTEADEMIFAGNSVHYRGFTAHPKYLEAVDRMGIVAVWEQLGPPDFCDKVSGEWVCE